MDWATKQSGLIYSRCKGFFSFPKCPKRLWGPTNTITNGHRVSLTGTEWQGLKMTNFHHTSRLRMNGGITQLSHILRGVHLGNFTRLEIWDRVARPEDDQLHHLSRLRMNGGVTQLSHILRGVHLGNFTRLEITRQRGTIIKEKEISTQKPPRKSCMWVQRRNG